MVGIVGFAATVIGDNVGFAIGHYGGRAVVLRWGHYVCLTQERLDEAEIIFNRHGVWIITIARFIEGLRQANGVVAGTTGVRWRRFLVFNALGAALWVGTWVSLGYLAGEHIDAIYTPHPILQLPADRASGGAGRVHRPAPPAPQAPPHRAGQQAGPSPVQDHHP